MLLAYESANDTPAAVGNEAPGTPTSQELNGALSAVTVFTEGSVPVYFVPAQYNTPRNSIPAPGANVAAAVLAVVATPTLSTYRGAPSGRCETGESAQMPSFAADPAPPVITVMAIDVKLKSFGRMNGNRYIVSTAPTAPVDIASQLRGYLREAT